MYLRAFAEFEPDLVVLINYTREQMKGSIPEGVPFVTWVQDAMPHLFDARLGAAQEAIRTFLDEAPNDLRVGLVVFAGEAQVATPPTDDHELVLQAVQDVDQFLVFGGTAIGDALEAAVNLGKQATGDEPAEGEIAAPALSSTRSLAQAAAPCEKGESPVSILFLSDGAQTRGLLQPLEGAALAKQACYPVYTIALGTPDRHRAELAALVGLPPA